MEYGENRPTICYGVKRAHAKSLQSEFQSHGIPTAYMDAFTPIEERREIEAKSKSGEYKVVTNVGVLIKGIDWPWVSCASLNLKTLSDIKLQQIFGRLLRLSPETGKKNALIIDHGGSVTLLGTPIEIEKRHTCLDMGKKSKSSKSKPKEKLPTKCPKCTYLKPAGIHECPKCGFKPQKQSDVEYVEGKLVRFGIKKEKFSMDEKRQFFAELKQIYLDKKAEGKNYKEGWPAANYKNKFGVWPNDPSIRYINPAPPSQKTLNWVKSQLIRYNKKRK